MCLTGEFSDSDLDSRQECQFVKESPDLPMSVLINYQETYRIIETLSCQQECNLRKNPGGRQ